MEIAKLTCSGVTPTLSLQTCGRPEYAAKHKADQLRQPVSRRQKGESARRLVIGPVPGATRPDGEETLTEMGKRKRDLTREDRIQNEVIVDAYGPEEQALGWYYYLEDKIRFPFQAKCIVTIGGFAALKSEPIEVRCIAPEDACSADMLVLITWHGRNVAVPLSQLTPLEANESTTEAIRDWHIGSRKTTTSDMERAVKPFGLTV